MYVEQLEGFPFDELITFRGFGQSKINIVRKKYEDFVNNNFATDSSSENSQELSDIGINSCYLNVEYSKLNYVRELKKNFEKILSDYSHEMREKISLEATHLFKSMISEKDKHLIEKIEITDNYEIKVKGWNNSPMTSDISAGFSHSNPLAIAEKGKEIRSEHLKENQLSVLYSIMINSPLIKADLDSFRDYDFIKNSFKIIEQYAEGGMEILCKEVFEKNWNGYVLTEEYEYYDVDLLRFIYKGYIEASF